MVSVLLSAPMARTIGKGQNSHTQTVSTTEQSYTNCQHNKTVIHKLSAQQNSYTQTVSTTEQSYTNCQHNKTVTHKLSAQQNSYTQTVSTTNDSLQSIIILI
jgi:hypothetical protein